MDLLVLSSIRLRLRMGDVAIVHVLLDGEPDAWRNNKSRYGSGVGVATPRFFMQVPPWLPFCQTESFR